MLSPAALGVALYALAALGIAAWLYARRARLGQERAGSWIAIVGIILFAGEDPVLALWYALAPPAIDPDGAAGVLHEHTRGHMFGAGVWALLAFAILIVLAVGALRRRERVAWRIHAAALGLAVVVSAIELIAFYPHGLDGVGFGWPAFPAGALAWALGLWMTRPAPA